jgi:hypothetical protein
VCFVNRCECRAELSSNTWDNEVFISVVWGWSSIRCDHFVCTLRNLEYMCIKWRCSATPCRRQGGEEINSKSFLALERVVSVTPRPPVTPGERTPGTHCTGGWVGPRAGLDTDARGRILLSLPVVEPRSPCRPVCSQKIYWLSYPGSKGPARSRISFKKIRYLRVHVLSKMVHTRDNYVPIYRLNKRVCACEVSKMESVK